MAPPSLAAAAAEEREVDALPLAADVVGAPAVSEALACARLTYFRFGRFGRSALLFSYLMVSAAVGVAAAVGVGAAVGTVGATVGEWCGRGVAAVGVLAEGSD